MERRGFLGALGAIGAAIVGRNAIPPVAEPPKVAPPFLKIEPVTVPVTPAGPAFDPFGMYIEAPAGEALLAGEAAYFRDDGKLYRSGAGETPKVVGRVMRRQENGHLLVNIRPWYHG